MRMDGLRGPGPAGFWVGEERAVEPEGYVSPWHLCLEARLFLCLLGMRFDSMYPDCSYEELGRDAQAR